jgi:predicted nucleic acid-binding protein
LIDANVLITLVVVEHEHHELAEAWFESQPEVLLCPTVEGALPRPPGGVGDDGR